MPKANSKQEEVKHCPHCSRMLEPVYFSNRNKGGDYHNGSQHYKCIDICLQNRRYFIKPQQNQNQYPQPRAQ